MAYCGDGYVQPSGFMTAWNPVSFRYSGRWSAQNQGPIILALPPRPSQTVTWPDAVSFT